MKNFLETIVKIILVLGIIYLIYSNFSNVSIDNNYKNVIDSIDTHIRSLERKQDSLNTDIEKFNHEIDSVDVSISKIKNEKTIIKEIYHEKIISVDSYNNNDIDSFFADRYGK